MYARAKTRLSTDIVMKFFSIETLSELARISIEIVRVCIKFGASLKELGKALSQQLTNYIILKKKYGQVCGYLIGIAIPLHATQASVIALVLTLMEIFNSVLTQFQLSQISVPLHPVDMNILTQIAMFLIITSIVSTSYSIYAIRASSSVIFTYYLGFISIVSALTFYLVSTFAVSILGGLLGELAELGKISVIQWWEICYSVIKRI